METVKMTSQVQVRTKAGGRNMSADSTVEKDAFLKLLQEKKELAQPGDRGQDGVRLSDESARHGLCFSGGDALRGTGRGCLDTF